jgi:murein DD-endopeptidase MepM/ murein hydrolase activator NlpD
MRAAAGALLCMAAAAATAPGPVARPIASAALTSPSVAPPWVWPVPAPIRVLAPFRAPMNPYSAGHRGIDLAVERGGVVVAAGAGTVRHAGWVVDRFLVAIDHGDGIISSIEPVEPSVVAGEAVVRGTPIGKVGSGGHCADACAHFGVRVHGVYVSPFLFLGGVPRAVLLPLGR